MSREWTNRRVLTTLVIAILITLAASQAYLLFAGPTRHTVSGVTTNSNPGTGQITVTGTGTAHVAPDKALVSLGILVTATTASAAVENAATTMSQVISGLHGIGVSDSDIQTTYYGVNAQYTYNNGVPPTLTGYQVTNQIQVTINTSTSAQLGPRAGQVIDAAASNGANQINGVTFTAQDTDYATAKQTALHNAVIDASDQAHIIASALNISITGVVSVTTSPGYFQPIYYDSIRLAAFSASTPISAPQSLPDTVTVQVVFSTA